MEVDRDAHGTWLLVEPNGEYRRGDEPPRHDKHGFIVLVPTDGWWTANFNAVAHQLHGHLVYVNINTAAHWDEDSVHLIDLDLDVTLSPDGSVRLLDEDEFEAHQALYRYPQDIIDRTRTTAAEVLEAASRRDEPFGIAGFAYVAEHLGWAPGNVVDGHGAASGRGGDPRFPQGTLTLQFPHFAEAGIPVEEYLPATININLPFHLAYGEPAERIRQLEWLAGYPAESFEFFDARIAVAGVVHPALVYRPDPATKPEFAQPHSVVEVLAAPIDGIEPGTPVSLWVDPDQARFVV